MAGEHLHDDSEDPGAVWDADGCAAAARRATQYEAVLGHLTTGVAIFEPTEVPGELRLAVVNEVAATYFGRIDDTTDVLAETQRVFDEIGLTDIALLVSVTGQSHAQEAVPAAGWLAAGRFVDVLIAPLADGAVALTFDDITDRRGVELRD